MPGAAMRICRTHTPPVWQGHIRAAEAIGGIYFWGQGVARDYPQAMAAYKVGAEGGDAKCQHQLGIMYYLGQGVAVHYEQARLWLEKAAAQNYTIAVGQLATMYHLGKGVTPSWRRARELYKRAIELGLSEAVQNMQNLTKSIANVTRSAKPPHPAQIHSHTR